MKNTNKEIHFRLPPEAHKYLVARAKKENRKINNLLVHIVEEQRVSDKSK